jgi:hypothetical protein
MVAGIWTEGSLEHKMPKRFSHSVVSWRFIIRMMEGTETYVLQLLLLQSSTKHVRRNANDNKKLIVFFVNGKEIFLDRTGLICPHA